MKTHIKKLIGGFLLALVLLTTDSTVANLSYYWDYANGDGFQADATINGYYGWTWGAFGSGTAQEVGQRSRGYRSGAWETTDIDDPTTTTSMIAEWYWSQYDDWDFAYSKVYLNSAPDTTYGRGDVSETAP